MPTRRIAQTTPPDLFSSILEKMHTQRNKRRLDEDNKSLDYGGEDFYLDSSVTGWVTPGRNISLFSFVPYQAATAETLEINIIKYSYAFGLTHFVLQRKETLLNGISLKAYETRLKLAIIKVSLGYNKPLIWFYFLFDIWFFSNALFEL